MVKENKQGAKKKNNGRRKKNMTGCQNRAITKGYNNYCSLRKYLYYIWKPLLKQIVK